MQSGLNGITPSEISGWIKVDLPALQSAVQKLVNKNQLILCEERLIHVEKYNEFVSDVKSSLDNFHKSNPLKQGMTKETLRAIFKGIDQKIFETLLSGIPDVAIERDIVRLKTFSISLSDDKKVLKEKILKVLDKAAFQPPSRDELAKTVEGNFINNKS